MLLEQQTSYELTAPLRGRGWLLGDEARAPLLGRGPFKQVQFLQKEEQEPS